MVNEHKRIVLLIGLTPISDDHFRLFKSLMSSDLRLERSMQEQYTRVQIADMMEDEFPDAGLSQLIKFCEDLPALRKRADILRKERSKVIRESSIQKTKQEAGPPTTTSTSSHMLASERGKTYTAPAETSTAQVKSSTAQKKRKQITKTEGGKKKKLTEEQAHLPETSRTNVKKDVDCVQTRPKSPPALPPSCSSNKKKKNTTIQKHSITKPEGTQEKQQLGEFSPTNNFSAVPMVPPATIPSSLIVPPVSMSIAINRAQTTQIHPGTGLISVQALHVPPSTVSRSVCSTHKGAAFCTGKDLSLPKVTSSRNFQASQVSSATASSSILVPYAISSTASSSILASYASSSSASSSLQAPHATSATTSSSLQASHATPSTASSSLQAPHGTSSTAFSSHLAVQLPLVTASRTLHVTPEPSATVHSSPTRTPRRRIVPMEPAKEEGHQKGPKQVMVLKVTEIFTYDMKEDKRMFHATVATETEFFRVKVFDSALKSKFIPRNIITISNYFGCDGFLEIYRASCVSDVHDNQTMVISKTLRQKASATPKLSYLFSQRRGTFVNGEFVVFKKTERNEFICYEIKDDTGIMEVVVYGRLTNIRCEPGSKLRLVCFELTSTGHMWQLRSVRHSYMQVINGRM